MKPLPHCLHKLFQKRHHYLDVRLNLSEKYTVFSICGDGADVALSFKHILQCVSKIDYYQVEAATAKKTSGKSVYLIGISLSNTTALADMFWYLHKKGIDPNLLINPLKNHVSYHVLENALKQSEEKATIELPCYNPPNKTSMKLR